MTGRAWEDVQIGDVVGPTEFPLSVYRLVVAAGANRDFNSIHHNSEYAQRSGAPEMYANTLFLQGMWERSVRDYVGTGAIIRRLAGFRMKSFNCAGDTVVVKGRVIGKAINGDRGDVEIEIWSENNGKVTVGPGMVTVSYSVTGID